MATQYSNRWASTEDRILQTRNTLNESAQTIEKCKDSIDPEDLRTVEEAHKKMEAALDKILEECAQDAVKILEKVNGQVETIIDMKSEIDELAQKSPSLRLQNVNVELKALLESVRDFLKETTGITKET
ncbi:hypothetical protein K469DRAFT_703899 [Zopfia rhizophila CBS 207.26]|uniref:Uncharacterized protein n=1 Tax=Zopfia rhizophila CBS 207.26 TaxID=1314779 RepID=A0A6A6EET4_9PEZI|nr:hypothetical protein K469DRAFT_703899 [Zopfia rhizophila CBS 207.26]